MIHFVLTTAAAFMVAVQSCSNDTYCQTYWGQDYVCVNSSYCEYMNCGNTPNYCDTHGPLGSTCDTMMNYCGTQSCYMDDECTTPPNTICDISHMACVPDCTTFTDPLFCSQKRNSPRQLCNTTTKLCGRRSCATSLDCGLSQFVCENGECVQHCNNNDTFCTVDLNYDPEYMCQSSGLCEITPCTTNSECFPNNCDTNNGYCVPLCANDNECAERNHWDWDYKCGASGYCVYRQCQNDTGCLHYGMMGVNYTCDISNPSRWECVEPDCRAQTNPSLYCLDHYGTGQECNTTSGGCEYSYCYQDSECNSGVCQDMMYCMPDCSMQDATWCATVNHDQYYSCNDTSGHCWHKDCDVAAFPDECPVGYVCKDRGGWGTCGVACQDDAQCAQDHNNDESYRCQSTGLCERNLCPCGDAGYVCNTLNECVPECTNSTQCMMDHMWDDDWKCGDGYGNNWCVYRQCENDTSCASWGNDYICNQTNVERWECEIPYCGDDGDCIGTDICKYMDNRCVPGCTNSSYCSQISYGMKPICDVATMKCEEENCVNTPGRCANMGPEYICNTTTGYCQSHYCYNTYTDAECQVHDPNLICDNMMGSCVMHCNTQSTDWCGKTFYEYKSCNLTSGLCWEKPCDPNSPIDYCPIDYVCKDRGGWGTCALDCMGNDTYCAEVNGWDTSYKCQLDGTCAQNLCTSDLECDGGFNCNTLGVCVPQCTSDYNCSVYYNWDGRHFCGINDYCVYRECSNDYDCGGSAWKCNTTSSDDSWDCYYDGCSYDDDCSGTDFCPNMRGYCVPGCTNSSYCAQMTYHEKPYCNEATMECMHENCMNSPGYCSRNGNGPGSFCNTTTGYCDITHCYDDSQCDSLSVCHEHDRCVQRCESENSDWCAKAWNWEYSSCNSTNGHCWERPCNLATPDCPLGYVCKDRGGWAVCAVSCDSNDTYCAQQNNYDSSFKCQANGLCERDTCGPPLYDCDSNSTCSAGGECVPECQWDYDCQRMNHYDYNWKCGSNDYCVYRECGGNNTADDCGYGSTCDMSQPDYYWCDTPWCNNDGNCTNTERCDYNTGTCVPSCALQNDAWCAVAFNREYSSCDISNGHCWEKPCTLATPDCPNAYVCKDRGGQWATCALSCDYANEPNDTYCAQQNNYDSSYQCQSSGLCERDTCGPPLYACSGTFTCNTAGECVPGCQNDYDCYEANNYNSEWKCGNAGHCVYRQCNDTAWCERNWGAGWLCNTTRYDSWRCEEHRCDSNSTIDDCSDGYICDYNRCIRSCDFNDTFCEVRYGYGSLCGSDGKCDYNFMTTNGSYTPAPSRDSSPPSMTTSDTSPPLTTTALELPTKSPTEDPYPSVQTTEILTEISTADPTTETPTADPTTPSPTEEPDEYCSDEAETGLCFKDSGLAECRNWVQGHMLNYRNRDGVRDNKLCTICSKNAAEPRICQCLALLKDAMVDDLLYSKDFIKEKILETCWKSEDCDDFANVQAIDGETACSCSSLTCSGTIGGIEDVQGGGGSNNAYQYNTGVVAWIAFVFYVLQ